MTVACPIPDPQLGVAVQLSRYLDCEAHAIGENGFAILTGSATLNAMLSGMVTIFVALIGYQVILGSLPSLRQGAGWAIRLGFVLALVTSWPAFQTLVYRIAVDAPIELAVTLLPATGLSAEGAEQRVQDAYDVMRRGRSTGFAAPIPAPVGSTLSGVPASVVAGFTPMPQTASLFVASTIGIRSVLRLVAGLLVAVGPLAALCLLFEGSQGVFEGWTRVLGGVALGALLTGLVLAVELALMESQIAAIGTAEAANQAATLDPQALATLTLVFGLLALLLSYVSLRIGAGFRLPHRISSRTTTAVGHASAATTTALPVSRTVAGEVGAPVRSRAALVADALRDAGTRGGRSVSTRASIVSASFDKTGNRDVATPRVVPLGVSGRRAAGRRTRSAQRRDNAS